MKLKYYSGLIFFFFFFGLNLSATHIVGGYFNYRCINSSNPTQVVYEIEFRMYVDCINGNPQATDPEIIVSIFNQSNQLLRLNFDTLQRNRTRLVPSEIDNPCIVESPDVCVQEVFYSGLISIPKNQNFLLVYQRCCRNSIIDNITNPRNQGNTFSIEVPSFNSVGCNASPQFNQFPPISICAGFDVDLDLSASDFDGDSLVYSLCAPLNYSNQFNPRPVPAFPPPYQEIQFIAPQTAANPIPSSPQLSINAATGKLSGIPTILGTFVVGFCVEEYRNGVLLSTTRRDVQINTGDCVPLISSAVQDQEQFCTGLTVQFRNNSFSPNATIQGYKWDFGDPTRLDDTSRLFEPTYTYADTGIYTITLIANPDLPCSDTSTNEFRVLQLLDPSIDTEGQLCADENNINFSVGGAYENYATFNWDFGTQANIPLSNQNRVNNVSFTGAGPFPVQLIVNQDNCTDTILESISLFDNPIAGFDFDVFEGCSPLFVNYRDLSSFSGSRAQYFWDFGDNTVSNDVNPSHTYSEPGFYSIGLLLITEQDCIDTVLTTLDSAIRVFPNPQSILTIADAKLNLKNARFEFDGRSSFNYDSAQILIAGSIVSYNDFFTTQLRDTGRFDVDLITFNEFGCSDTSSSEIYIFEEFEFIIPNIFTPNGDGINDDFKVRACGVYEYEIAIYNRFGSQLFESNSMNINWDGRVNGYKASSGVYFYVIRVMDFKSDYYEYSGTVTLLAE